MSRDKIILILCWMVNIVLLIKLIPANKLRQGLVPFFFKQTITWLFGLIVVENRFIKYPVKEFKHAYKGSFTFEYFLYPSVCAFFNLYYPENRNKLSKFLYINLFAGIITIAEVMLEKYTNLIKYVKWKWYWSYITMAVSNYSSQLFYRWFFKETTPPE